MHELRNEDASYTERAPDVRVFHGTVRADRDAVWASVADAASWPAWFPGVRSSGYATPAPSGLDSVRTLHLRPNARFVERIVAWEPGERWGFCVVETNQRLAHALVEIWTFADAPTGGTAVSWTFAVDKTPLGRILLSGAGPVMNAVFQRALRNLGRHLS